MVLEFSINEHPEAPYTDRQRMGYEQLIRKLLRMPGRCVALPVPPCALLRLDCFKNGPHAVILTSARHSGCFPCHCRPALIQLHYYAWWRSEGDGVEQGLFYFPQAEAQLTVFSQVRHRLRSAPTRRMPPPINQ